VASALRLEGRPISLVWTSTEKSSLWRIKQCSPSSLLLTSWIIVFILERSMQAANVLEDAEALVAV
jgi:hypothetical protein